MKYIISDKQYGLLLEGKLEDTIFNYMNELFYGLTIEVFGREDEFDFTDIIKKDDFCRLHFILDYEEIFIYYKKCWWNVDKSGIGNAHSIKKFNESPLLYFESCVPRNTLNGYFGDLWVPVLKKWFEEKFKLEVKTLRIIN
jgi:hypothetical protein